jgi:hypothetical protein
MHQLNANSPGGWRRATGDGRRATKEFGMPLQR